jgi:hypothetical protein
VVPVPTFDAGKISSRFLELPFRQQIAIAQALEFSRDIHNDNEFFRGLFKWASEKNLVGKLQQEIDKLYPEPKPCGCTGKQCCSKCF